MTETQARPGAPGPRTRQYQQRADKHQLDQLDRNGPLCQSGDYDPELWFPVDHARATPAQRVCADCPARRACLEYALVHGEDYGVWGGLSEYQRFQLRRSLVRAVRVRTGQRHLDGTPELTDALDRHAADYDPATDTQHRKGA